MTPLIADVVALAGLVASALAEDCGLSLSEHPVKTSFVKSEGSSTSVHYDHGSLPRST
jgi:hypothetical protein